MRMGRRLIYLEAIRGIASLVVINHHLLYAFAPELRKPFPNGVMFTPLFPFMNGDAAVQFFFVLSGFVLSLGLIQAPSTTTLVYNCLKRLPRLIVPVAASIFLGYALVKYGLTFHVPAGDLTRSKWLTSFGNAGFPGEHVVSFADALKQSLTVLLLPNSFYYNSNLWTMRIEFYGSIVVFCSAELVGRLVRPKTEAIAFLTFVIATAALVYIDRHFIGFMCGLLLAYIHRRHKIAISDKMSAVFMAIAFGALIFQNVFISAFGATLMLFAVINAPAAEKLLSNQFGIWLGKFSFPIYLVHTLVICSIGSYVYIACVNAAAGALPTFLAVAATTFLVTFLAAIPFVFLEEWWVPTLNRAVTMVQSATGTSPEKPAPKTRRRHRRKPRIGIQEEELDAARLEPRGPLER